MEGSSMDNEKKEIEVVKGDGKDLTISTVYEHIKKDDHNISEKKNEEVIIPKGSKKEENKQE